MSKEMLAMDEETKLQENSDEETKRLWTEKDEQNQRKDKEAETEEEE